MIVFRAGDDKDSLPSLVRDIDELDHFISRMHLTRYDSDMTTAKRDALRRVVSTYKHYIINPLALKLGMKMNKPLYDIADGNQLEYVLNTIEDLDFKIARRQRSLAINCPESIAAYEALRHLRDLIEDFSLECIAAAIGSESDRDDA